jgi:hypothetical protein
MIEFTALLEKFGEMGEKTGWTCFTVPASIAEQLKPGVKVSFRVKGTIDGQSIKQTALLPMGDGDFILPLRTEFRRKIRKEAGDTVRLSWEADESEILISEDLLICLAEEPAALERFETMPKSHQRYYSNWVEQAKTLDTKSRRIAMAVEGLKLGMDYGAMMRYYRDNK